MQILLPFLLKKKRIVKVISTLCACILKKENMVDVFLYHCVKVLYWIF